MSSIYFLKIFLFCFFVINPSFAFAFRFAVYGDSRAPKGDPTLVNRDVLGYINRHVHALHPRPDLVLFVGDAMNRSWSKDYTRNLMPDWIHFMRQGLKKIPLYMAAGNTEFYGNTGWTEYPLQTQYQNTFSFLPDNGPEHYKRLAYSLNHGKGKESSLFVVMDAFGFYESNGELQNFDNGFDKEQTKWFAKTIQNSKAHHKFVISHGPAFSVEGYPIKDSVRKMWSIMTKNRCDLFFCGHEHIFSRWLITKKTFPQAHSDITQTIVGSAGALPDNPQKVVVDPQEAHIHSGYTFVVVDVDGDKITQRSYGLVSKPEGGFSTRLIDKFSLKK